MRWPLLFLPTMKRAVLFCLLAAQMLPPFLHAQRHDFTLVFGYAGGNESPNDDTYGINVMTFGDGNVKLSDNQTIGMHFNDTHTSMSDSAGNLIFYYNGLYVENAAYQIMENGDSLNEYDADNFGYGMPQGAVAIPYPGHSDQYILFHGTDDYFSNPQWSFQGIGLFYSVIDMKQNNGLGSVVERKKTLVIDTLTYGKLMAVRHANGRDWWLIVGESHTNRFYTVFIDPNGVHLLGTQAIGIRRKEGYGHAYFSPDGTKYAICEGIDSNGPNWSYLYVYDFDRCTGQLSHQKEVHLWQDVGVLGIAISPNSRYLYCAALDNLVQYDLSVSYIENSRTIVGVYDGWQDPFPAKFDKAFLAPDGKIYVVTSSGSRTLYVINDPDEPGLSCNFEQPGLRLPCRTANTAPNFPNYRLGPLDGSSCDTLGLDNHPVAWWRSAQDTLAALKVAFHDLSYYEPTGWLWDFGDGKKSTERHPMHSYDTAGVYQACLTVSNVMSSNTLCRKLYLGVISGVENPVPEKSIRVFPNPATDYLSIESADAPAQPMRLRCYDTQGRLMQEQAHPRDVRSYTMDVSGLPVGYYLLEIGLDDGSRVVEKVVIVR